MEQHTMDNEATTLNECKFSFPRYLCQKLDMFGRAKLYAATSKRHANLKVRGAECVLLENRQDGLLSLSPSKIRTDNIFSQNVKAWVLPPIHNPAAEGVGLKVNSLGFPEVSSQKNGLGQTPAGRPQKEKQTRPPRLPSCRTPDELAKQVESYAHQVAELLNSMQISLRQEEERRKNAEQQAVEVQKNLSLQLVGAQRSRSELRARLNFEQQERAIIGARLSVLSETVAQGYGPHEDAQLRGIKEGAISRVLNSLAEARIESLKDQVKQLESRCDWVKTYEKVCHRRETAWKFGLLTLVQAALICIGVGIVFGRPIFFGNLIPS